MLNRNLVLRSLALSLAICAGTAAAHDPRFHEPEYQALPPAKAKPETCVQLADTERYSNDISDADIKKLKTRCDAEKAAAARKAAAKQKKK
jgi:hypothetical protein